MNGIQDGRKMNVNDWSLQHSDQSSKHYTITCIDILVIFKYIQAYCVNCGVKLGGAAKSYDKRGDNLESQYCWGY